MASLSTLKINSYFYIGLMFLIFGLFLVTVGFIIGIPFYFMIFLFLIIVVIQILVSSSIVKWSTGTRLLAEGENPYLEDMVRRLTSKAEIPMPKLGMVEDSTPNAFVYGLSASGSTLSVHRGLLEKLNDSEIEAVIGHEMGHIKNRDCMYMTILSVMPLIAYFGMRSLLYTRVRSRNSKGAGVIVLIGLASLIVYFLTSLLIKKISRIREFYADAYSGYITNNPQALASALTKITYGLSLAPADQKTKNAARSFYIGDVQNAHKEMDRIIRNKDRYDLDGDGVIDEHELEIAMSEEANNSAWERFGGLFATHPPTFKRILALKEMDADMRKGNIPSDNIYEKVEF